ncbi:MAG: transglycosylase family protein [Actinobacteria bacterium]|nr:transglycosylase family protein [Actinomycetota bacterium]MCB9413332.1 transglycosylase family protein [Actinomycetota bacterium]
MRAEAAFIAAIQANMRARAAAANPFAASEAWASSAFAQSVIRCESGGNYSINTGNGYYGAWQFDYGTWLGNGGGQFAPYAHLATPAQQNYIAYRTWQARGWQPWACA